MSEQGRDGQDDRADDPFGAPPIPGPPRPRSQATPPLAPDSPPPPRPAIAKTVEPKPSERAVDLMVATRNFEADLDIWEREDRGDRGIGTPAARERQSRRARELAHFKLLAENYVNLPERDFARVLKAQERAQTLVVTDKRAVIGTDAGDALIDQQRRDVLRELEVKHDPASSRSAQNDLVYSESPRIPDRGEAGGRPSSAAERVAEAATGGLFGRGRRARANRLANQASQARDLAASGPEGIAAAAVAEASERARSRLARSVSSRVDKLVPWNRVPVFGKVKASGGGSMISGLEFAANRNPLYRFVFAHLPFGGNFKKAMMVGCGCASCGGGCGCGGCAGCGLSCGIPLMLVFFVLAIIGVNIAAQPGFVNPQFCEANNMAVCDPNIGITLQLKTGDLPSGSIAIYKSLEKKYGVPWFYIAAWERVATDFGTEAPQHSDITIPDTAREAAIDFLEAEIKVLYPAAPIGPHLDNNSNNVVPAPVESVNPPVNVPTPTPTRTPFASPPEIVPSPAGAPGPSLIEPSSSPAADIAPDGANSGGPGVISSPGTILDWAPKSTPAPKVSAAPSPVPSTPAAAAPSAAPLATLNPAAAAADQATKAQGLRDALAASMQLLNSAVRGHSFGLMLTSEAEFSAYGTTTDPTSGASVVLSPWDRSQAGDMLSRHIVDVYEQTLRPSGILTDPGDPIYDPIASDVEDWIQLHYQDDLAWYKSVAAGIPSSSSDTGYQPGNDSSTKVQIPLTWKDGPKGPVSNTFNINTPNVGQPITLPERYLICTLVKAKDCSIFLSGVSSLEVSPDVSFAKEVSAFYDPTLPPGEQIVDWSRLKLLMGAIFNDQTMWGGESTAWFSAPNVTEQGQSVGSTIRVNAYVQAINSYAKSLYDAWAVTQTSTIALGSIEGPGEAKSTDLEFWKATVSTISDRTGMPWPYIAATIDADGGFSCERVDGYKITDPKVIAAIQAGDHGPPGGYYFVAPDNVTYLSGTNPSGMRHCWRFGVGTASFYANAPDVEGVTWTGPVVAMNYCDSVFRHANGTKYGDGTNCGEALLTDPITGHTVTAKVVDFCDCFTTSSPQHPVTNSGEMERIADLNAAAWQDLYWTQDPKTGAITYKPYGLATVEVQLIPPTDAVGWPRAFVNAYQDSGTAIDPFSVACRTTVELFADLGTPMATASNADPCALPDTAAGATPAPNPPVPNMLDFYVLPSGSPGAWAQWSICGLSTNVVPVLDLTDSTKVLGNAATCPYIDKAALTARVYAGALSVGGFVPAFVSEREGPSWGDCTLAAALMAANKMTLGLYPATDAERDALRALTAVPAPVGTSLDDVARALLARYNIILSRPSAGLVLNWNGFKDKLANGNGAILQGLYSDLGAAYISPDAAGTDFAAKGGDSRHAMYIDRYDPDTDMFWVMDPLLPWGASGQWVPSTNLEAFADGMAYGTGYVEAALAPEGSYALANAQAGGSASPAPSPAPSTGP